jgi:hypothetical protein
MRNKLIVQASTEGEMSHQAPEYGQEETKSNNDCNINCLILLQDITIAKTSDEM